MDRRQRNFLIRIGAFVGGIGGLVALWQVMDTPFWLHSSRVQAMSPDGYYKVSLSPNDGAYQGVQLEERPWGRKPNYGVLSTRSGEFTHVVFLDARTVLVEGRGLDAKLLQPIKPQGLAPRLLTFRVRNVP